jgi:hypothetical protein
MGNLKETYRLYHQSLGGEPVIYNEILGKVTDRSLTGNPLMFKGFWRDEETIVDAKYDPQKFMGNGYAPGYARIRSALFHVAGMHYNPHFSIMMQPYMPEAGTLYNKYLVPHLKVNMMSKYWGAVHARAAEWSEVARITGKWVKIARTGEMGIAIAFEAALFVASGGGSTIVKHGLMRGIRILGLKAAAYGAVGYGLGYAGGYAFGADDPAKWGMYGAFMGGGIGIYGGMPGVEARMVGFASSAPAAVGKVLSRARGLLGYANPLNYRPAPGFSVSFGIPRVRFVGGRRVLYRGVPSGTQRGRDALKGIVRPRGESQNYLKHVEGGDVAADVTSWTTDKNIAKRFGDIILEIEEKVVKHKIVPHPAPGLYAHEKEVLIRGVLRGVKIAK